MQLDTSYANARDHISSSDAPMLCPHHHHSQFIKYILSVCFCRLPTKRGVEYKQKITI